MRVVATRRVSVTFALCAAMLIGLWLASQRAIQRQVARTMPASPGSVAFRDPHTGAFSAPPGGAVLQPQSERLKAALAVRQGGIVESKARSRAGGVRVQLGGRFTSYLVARRDSLGHLVFDCASAQGARLRGKE